MTTRKHETQDTSPILAEANEAVREPINRIEALVSHGSARARRVSRRSQAYVRHHTWSTLAGAALVGMLAGVCLMRHGDRD
jgi:ElaB/YqjD/DUF883 family membrane-anchored ribosome-binding protein